MSFSREDFTLIKQRWKETNRLLKIIAEQLEKIANPLIKIKEKEKDQENDRTLHR